MIKCKFSCDECGLKDIEVLVPARASPLSDIKTYMDQVVASVIYRKHQSLSPQCKATTITQLMIPLPADDDPNPWIGKQT